MERLEQDVAELAGMTRGSCGPGERASAAWIARRLGGEVQPYRGQTTYAWSYALHALGGLLAARLPRRLGWPLAALLLVSLEGDASARLPLVRRLLPTGEGANVVLRVPAAGERRRTVVLVAHHDAQRTGLIWHPALHEPGAARRLKKRSIPAYLPPAGVALLAHRTRPGRLLLRFLLALSLDQATNRTVPGANDNATGVAAAIALAERYEAEALDGAEVVVAIPGGEESGMQGMRAFLAAHDLDLETTLVVCLDTLGCGRPIVLRAEHTMLRQGYAERDLALVPADVERWSLGGWTDALQAKFAGLRTLSFLSIGPKGLLTHYHRPDDTPDHVDFASVRACIEAVDATIRAFVRG
jgi:hypothetical protein